MAETARVMMWMSDVHKQCTYFNRDWLDFTGQTLEHELGDGWAKGVHPDDYDRCLRTYVAAFDAREDFKMEYRLRHHSGEYRPILDAGMPRYSADGKFNGYVGSCIEVERLPPTADDVADRRHLDAVVAERTAALYDSEQRFRRIVETTLDGIWTFDVNDRIDYVNQQAAKMLQYAPQEILGRTPLDFLFPEDVARGQERLRRRRQGIHEVLQTRFRRKDGSEIFLQRAASPILDANGEYRGGISIFTDITEIKRTEQKLSESEQRFRAIIDAEPECVKLLDSRGQLLEMNPAGLMMIEADSLEQARKFSMADLVLPQYRAEFLALGQRVFGGEEGTLVFEIVGLKGTRRWMETHALPLRNALGEVTALLGVTRDITAHKHAVEELRRQKELLQKVVDHIPAMITVRDAADRLQMANREWERVTGWTVEEARDRDMFAEMYPDPRDREFVADFRRQSRAEWAEFHTRVRDGSYRDTTWANVQLSDGTNIGVGKDITAQKRADAALLASLELNRRIVEAVPAGVVELAEDFAIVQANENAQRILGLTYDEITQRYVADFASDTIREDGTPFPVEEYPAVQCLRTNRQPPPATVGVRRPNGSIAWAVFTAFPLSHPHEDRATGAIVTFLDITPRKRFEEEQRQLEARMMTAEKVESLGVLSGGIAHDFNNLLQGIVANVELALDETPEASPAVENLNQVLLASQRAAELIDQMLAYSGQEQLDLEPVDLSRLVLEMTRLVEASISKKARVQGEFATDLPSVAGDAVQLRRIVMNLITNAAEALGDAGGTIHVATGVTRVTMEDARDMQPHDSLAPGEYVYLDVIDTGCGMTAETAARIFEPFYTTKFAGRGLGLPAVLGIVRSHHGGIRVRSGLGTGTTFRVCFPIASQPALAAAPPSKTLPAAEWRGSGTVLVVDDEPLIRTVTRTILERAGCKVLTAAHGREALDLAARHADEIRAVILDLTMPEMDGAETLRELRRLRIDTPVLLASGYSEEEATGQFVGAGLAGFLQKPYLATQLLEKLQRVMP